MAKLLLILFFGLTVETIGIVLLKKGMNQLPVVTTVRALEIVRVVKAGVVNPSILFGVFFQAIYFGCLLILMSESDVSFLWPLTALTFVFSTVAAVLFLQEKVSSVRWAGIVFIMIGAGLITYSEHVKPKPAPNPETHIAQ